MTSSETPTETLEFIGCLKGHSDWVTSIKTAPVESLGQTQTVVSTSRDKKVIVWKFQPEVVAEDNTVGYALRAFTGHSQAIQDLSLSSNGRFGLTGSWDKTLRLWDFETGAVLRTFLGHTKDVLSVALSPDNRQIVSGSRDKTIKLWNTIGECKFTIDDDRHNDWVSCVRFSPIKTTPTIVSCGWDKVVKVWDLSKCLLKTNLLGHSSAVYTVTVSPDGSLCASGGRDGVAMLWDVDEGKHLYSLPASCPINSLCFSPCNYWLCASTDKSVKIWNLEDKKVLFELVRPMLEDDTRRVAVADSNQPHKRPPRASGIPWCTTLSWSTDGSTLFVGSNDGRIFVYEIKQQ